MELVPHTCFICMVTFEYDCKNVESYTLPCDFIDPDLIFFSVNLTKKKGAEKFLTMKEKADSVISHTCEYFIIEPCMYGEEEVEGEERTRKKARKREREE